MKRIYACILIVAALLGVSLYSSGRVQGFAQDISADLDCALEAVRQKDFPTARQALAEGAELCDTMRETMSHLLRTADYTELEAALRAADGYLEQQATEDALGELRRAQVEVERLEWLARRLVLAAQIIFHACRVLRAATSNFLQQKQTERRPKASLGLKLQFTDFPYGRPQAFSVRQGSFPHPQTGGRPKQSGYRPPRRSFSVPAWSARRCAHWGSRGRRS